MRYSTHTGGLTSITLCLAIAVAVGPGTAFGQPASTKRDSAVQRTAFVRSGNNGQLPPVRFGRNAARVGDRTEQKLTFEMRLTTSLRQGNQIVEKNQTTMRIDQQRVVTTTEVADGRAMSVMVRYVAATKQMAVIEQPASGNEPSAGSNAMPQTVQPVHGKMYRCKREGGEDGKLHVFDEAGQDPPSDELEIVSQNMEMIGRANPLAEFLAGKTVAIGETLSLPQDAADRLFNLGDRFGEVNRFELTLRKTLMADDVPCAEFVARIDAASNDSSQMRLQVEGPLVVQIATCRAVRTELSGPIALSETRGTYSTVSHLFGTGRMSMRIASEYGTQALTR
jgi:hypothetical protein